MSISILQNIALPRNSLHSSNNVLKDKPCLLQVNRVFTGNVSVTFDSVLPLRSLAKGSWRLQFSICTKSKIMSYGDTRDTVTNPHFFNATELDACNSSLEGLIICQWPVSSGMCQLILWRQKEKNRCFSNTILPVCMEADRITTLTLRFHIYFSPIQSWAT